VESIGRAVGWNGEVVVRDGEATPKCLRSEENLAQSLVTDSSRIRDEPRYEGTIFRDEALQRTVEWERANPDESLGDDVFDYAAEDAALG